MILVAVSPRRKSRRINILKKFTVGNSVAIGLDVNTNDVMRENVYDKKREYFIEEDTSKANEHVTLYCKRCVKEHCLLTRVQSTTLEVHQRVK